MLEFDPLDEYPIHQVPLPMRYVATATATCTTGASTRASITKPTRTSSPAWACTRTSASIDAYATVRRGDKQWAIRTSGSRPDDKMNQQVGPYRIEVIKPFRELRLICDADDHGLGFDLVYRSEYGPISEPQHIRRQGDRILLEASRFAGVGTFEGELRVDGDTIAVTPDRYTATRDRSWGIRPVGEAEPPGPPERLHRHVVVLDPAALRRLRAARHPRRGPRRPAQHELRGARVPRGDGPAARTTRLAAARDPLHVGHAQPDRRVDRADEPRRARRRRSRSSRSSASR